MDLNVPEIIDRMKMAVDMKNDSELARFLQITPQAIYKFRKSGKLPAELIIDFAQAAELSIDWLISGKGIMMADDLEKVGIVDEDLLKAVIVGIEESKSFATLEFPADEKAKYIIETYKTFSKDKKKNQIDTDLVKRMIDAFDTVVRLAMVKGPNNLTADELKQVMDALHWKK
ncbi:MAG: helix-turn-helix domain-containing protein [Geobacteraceae bacterium]|nr:helix-turn-helix domain-containing protein [Geobacteraceae bacterium]